MTLLSSRYNTRHWWSIEISSISRCFSISVTNNDTPIPPSSCRHSNSKGKSSWYWGSYWKRRTRASLEEEESGSVSRSRKRRKRSGSGPALLPLTEEQQRIFDAVVSDRRSVFITGPAGTGKTFLLRRIIHALHRSHPPGTVFVTASTGIAASALGGQTLHSFAGIGRGMADHNDLLEKASSDGAAVQRWRSARALVIDEISMIDGELFDQLDSIARGMRNPHHRRRHVPVAEPWGGIQLVVCGDFFQLPPVRPPNPDKVFAFEADCWDACFTLQVELTQVFRHHSDLLLLSLLQGIRRGRTDDLHLLHDHSSGLTGSCAPGALEGEEDDSTHLFPRNEDVRRLNQERLRSVGEYIVSYRAVDSGKEPWRRQLRQGIAPDELEICTGARVMLTRNRNTRQGLVNGACGVVTGFVQQASAGLSKLCSSEVLPVVKFDCGVELVVKPAQWEVVEGEKVKARRRQIPLILAWAVSVHKCQGMTLDRLHANLSRAFGCGMVYVALSRVRTLDSLQLSGFDPKKIQADPKVVQFYNRLLACGRACSAS